MGSQRYLGTSCSSRHKCENPGAMELWNILLINAGHSYQAQVHSGTPRVGNLLLAIFLITRKARKNKVGVSS